MGAYPGTINQDHVSYARAVAERLGSEWGLELGASLPGASCSLVLEVQDERVLKVPFPHAEEAGAWETVRAFSGHGGVQLIRSDPSSGALLMPRLRPGTMLGMSSLDNLEQVDVCAELMVRLRGSPVVDGIPLVRWFRELDEMVDSGLVRRARRIYGELIAHPTASVLLHGDLHHYNILRDGEAWVAIDPKGLIGDPCVDVSGFMRNNVGPVPTAAFMRARLERFAERLGDPISRLWGWAFVQTVLCTHGPGTSGGVTTLAAQAIWEARP